MATQKRQTETAMQMGVVRWARNMAAVYPCLKFLYHAANEGKVDPREAGKRQRMGVLAGVPDLFLPAKSGPHAGLYIELKKRPNKPTAEQSEFMAFAEAQGYATAVCYSLEEAVDTLTGYLKYTETEAVENG